MNSRIEKKLVISAPSRLHFGLFAVGDQVERSFGGIGLMIESPRTRLQLSQGSNFSVKGEGAKRIEEFSRLWWDRFGQQTEFENLDSVPLSIEVIATAPSHSGFGSGTQLAMATGSGLSDWFGLPVASAEELAITMNRGKRSAIGINGFFEGGLIVDRGKSTTDPEPVAPVEFQIDFPEDWPIVVALPQNVPSVFGQAELDAFRDLQATRAETRERMIRLATDQLLPAVASKDYDSFAPAIYEFGYLSGMNFELAQGGPYNGVAHIVDRIQELGVQAVGQSSWGPGVYAFCQNPDQAFHLKKNLQKSLNDQFEVWITKADNRGFDRTTLPG